MIRLYSMTISRARIVLRRFAQLVLPCSAWSKFAASWYQTSDHPRPSASSRKNKRHLKIATGFLPYSASYDGTERRSTGATWPRCPTEQLYTERGLPCQGSGKKKK